MAVHIAPYHNLSAYPLLPETVNGQSMTYTIENSEPLAREQLLIEHDWQSTMEDVAAVINGFLLNRYNYHAHAIVIDGLNILDCESGILPRPVKVDFREKHFDIVYAAHLPHSINILLKK